MACVCHLFNWTANLDSFYRLLMVLTWQIHVQYLYSNYSFCLNTNTHQGKTANLSRDLQVAARLVNINAATVTALNPSFPPI